MAGSNNRASAVCIAFWLRCRTTSPRIDGAVVGWPSVCGCDSRCCIVTGRHVVVGTHLRREGQRETEKEEKEKEERRSEKKGEREGEGEAGDGGGGKGW